MAAEIPALDWAIFQRGTLKKKKKKKSVDPPSVRQRKKNNKRANADEFQCVRRVTDRRCWRRNAEKRDFRWIAWSVTRRKTRSNVHRFLWKLRRPSRERHPPRSVTVRLARNTAWNSRVVYSSRQSGRSSPPRILSSRAWRNKDLFFWVEASIVRKWYIEG